YDGHIDVKNDLDRTFGFIALCIYTQVVIQGFQVLTLLEMHEVVTLCYIGSTMLCYLSLVDTACIPYLDCRDEYPYSLADTSPEDADKAIMLKCLYDKMAIIFIEL
ncbi:hypothetical protein ACJX0J_010149, partial [Zea mays]